MMDNNRVIALNLAVTARGPSPSSDADAIVNDAAKFLSFLEGAAATLPAAASPSDPAPRRGRPPKSASAPPAKSEEQLVAETIAANQARVAAEEEAAAAAADAAGAEAAKETVGKEDVTKQVSALINANKRNEAVKLLAKFGAKSISELPPSKYETFVNEAQAALLD